MSSCKLKILPESRCENSLFQAEGAFESIKGGERVRYEIDGDEGELFFSDAFFETRRRGKCGVRARFCKGEETEMTIGSSDLTGKIPVHTTHYLLRKDGMNRYIELCYDLFSLENIQTFSLKIQLFFSEEK